MHRALSEFEQVKLQEERDRLQEEIKRIVAVEREACAQVCEAVMKDVILGGNSDYNTGREMGATVCANRIRQRK